MLFKFLCKTVLPQPQSKQSKNAEYKPVKVVTVDPKPIPKDPVPAIKKNKEKVVRIKCSDSFSDSEKENKNNI